MFFIWNKVVFGDGPVTPVVGVRVGTAERKASGVSMIGNLFNRGRTSNDPPEYLSAPITALQIVNGGAVQSAFNVTNTVKLPDSENATNQAGALQGPAPA